MSRIAAPENDPAYRWGGLALALAAAAILTALAFEHLGGLEPCPLCLQQRYAFYAGVPALFAALVLLSAEYPRAAALLLFAVALAFLANSGLAVYHAGVEWKFWAGPDTCASGDQLKPLGGALLESLRQGQVRVVRCDEPAWQFLGLSFAGWNVIGSFVISVASTKAALAASVRIS